MRCFDIKYVRVLLEEQDEEAATGNSFVITVKGWPNAMVVPVSNDRDDRPGWKQKPAVARPARRGKG